MSTPQRWFSTLLSAVFPVILIITWLNFAPLALGGPATYVIINGVSMEPFFHTGDLVIARQQPFYSIGEQVVYQNVPMGRFVFHRIVGQQLERYVLKGDHNTWLDSYLPSSGDMVGAFWIYLPQLGVAVQWLRQPLVIGILTGILSLAILLTLWEARTPRRRRRKPNMKTSFGINPRRLSRISEGSFFALGLLLFLSVAAGFFAFRTPLLRQVPDDLPYQQSGEFFYSATAPAGIYDTPQIRSGDPIFLELTCQIDIGYRYRINGADSSDISGTQEMTAIVSDISGWKRTLVLQPPTTFNGNAYTTTATLDLCQVYGLAAHLEEITGLKRAEYSLSIEPVTTVNSAIGGKALQETLAPKLVFRFDRLNFWLTESTDPEIDLLRPTQLGMVRAFRTEENTLSILGAAPSVESVRILAGVGFGLSLIGLFVLLILIYRAEQAGPEAQINLRYGAMLVDVEKPKASKLSVTVASIEDLARLAERYSVPILHAPEGDWHIYTAQAEQITYRYSVQNPTPPKEPAIEEPSAIEEPAVLVETAATMPAQTEIVAPRSTPDTALDLTSEDTLEAPRDDTPPDRRPSLQTWWKNTRIHKLLTRTGGKNQGIATAVEPPEEPPQEENHD